MKRGTKAEKLAIEYLNEYANERKDSGVTEFFVVVDGEVKRQNAYTGEEYVLALQLIERQLKSNKQNGE